MPPRDDDMIAVDIVLLPPPDIRDEAIRINKELSARYDNEITLTKTACLAHITLAMACIKKGDMDGIKKALSSLARKARAIQVKTTPAPVKKAWLRIKNNEALNALHSAVMTGISDYPVHEP